MKDEGRFFNQNYVLEILIRSYSALKDYQHKTDALEQAIDIFDKMLQRPDYRQHAQHTVLKADEAASKKA
ncbi:hypothetical protein [Microscilla marina]|uniref:Uncharacterized protein n=1 Tax=Microscilla marina ATCC 23134 TaxID=313606 RepID=A1ZP63_MICM2|nr:hypothetical protein [Microscilla marina]EAY27855.1 hypothetical protein M23134_00296 [Microscilla marina ATCC 23134]